MLAEALNGLMRVARLCPLALLCAVPLVHAQIYGGLDADGGVVLSNFRTAETQQVVVQASGAAQEGALADTRFSPLIHKAAQASGLSAQLLHAVISVESGFNARAVSPKGAQGLMQLMPATARSLGVNDPFDPGQNITAGAAHLKSLLERFDNNLELALAAYNAGADAVIKAGYRIPPYSETRTYVPRVLAHLQRAGTSGAVSTR